MHSVLIVHDDEKRHIEAHNTKSITSCAMCIHTYCVFLREIVVFLAFPLGQIKICR